MPDDTACNDGLFCNGTELCDPALDCQAGTSPCADGVTCTLDTCDEAQDTCAYLADDSLCTDGLYCNGEESCNIDVCQPGMSS